MLSKDLINALSKKKVFVFDFDATLANTEYYSWIAHNKALEKYGIVLNDEHIRRYIGNNDEVIFNKIKEEFKIEFDSQKHLEERLEIYLNLVKENNLKCFNYFTQILKIFPNTDFYILSGSKEFVIRRILNMWQLESRFKEVISAFDQKISKKEVLINSQAYFKTTKENIVLFEDSTKTLKEAKELGVLAIGIRGEYNYKTLENYDFVIDVIND